MYDYRKSTWLNPNIEYLINTEITEYDMSDAGFNLIKQFRLLPSDKIQELERMGKGIERHIAVGKLQRDDKQFSEALLNKFAEARKIFIETNNLTDNDIVSVKKDAIFSTKYCRRTVFGGVHFNSKNKYSSYVRFQNIHNLEVYYNSYTIDIKGMNDIAVNSHRLYMYQFIRKTIGMLEDGNPRVKRYIIDFISRYKFHELDSDTYYLEFNNMSRKYDALFNYQNVLIPMLQIVRKEIR